MEVKKKEVETLAGGVVASIVIPVYNKERFLNACIATIDAQDMDHAKFEAIFVDDGSNDTSSTMLDSYERERSWVRVIHQPNEGVCSARNAGIVAARGKYIFYLDPDDEWSSNVLTDVSSFFDAHYDEVDLVTYRIRSFQNGKELAGHFRYSILAGSGVYKLDVGENCFICQTTMNVCVKNRYGKNHLFNHEPKNGVIIHEDLQYITEIVCERKAIGYCDGPEYFWYRNEQSVTNTISKQTEAFESTMQMYEGLLAKYASSSYVQALFFTDQVWKFREGTLLPYHYGKDAFDTAVARIRSLLRCVNPYIIVNHPAVDPFHRFFWLQQKGNVDVNCSVAMGSLTIDVDGQTVYLRQRIEAVLLRTTIRHGTLRVRGYLKSPGFQFGEKPRLFARMSLDGEARNAEVPLRESSWSYYKAKEITNVFWAFDVTCPVKQYGSLWLRVMYGDAELRTNFYLMPRCAFSNSRRVVIKDHFKYSVRKALGGFEIRKLNAEEESDVLSKRNASLRNRNPKVWAVRVAALKTKAAGRRIWLYYDCHGVEKNNGYYQFKHDIEIHDGIERYYVVNDSLSSKRYLFTVTQMTRLVKFGSKRHKLLFLAAEKVITAYVEQNNWLPFSPKVLPQYSDLMDAEIVYLQHGVLHAHMPWKYSLDRLGIDREVVSTHFEVQNLIDNYCFDEESLILAGAPRYDLMSTTKPPMRRILFAPSWRGFLVKQVDGRDWKRVPGALERSVFFREIMAFLESDALHTSLRRYGYTLDLKLHPIMAEVFHDEFSISSDVVRWAPATVDEADYSIFITDFSSYRFDFVYLKRAIMYFLPDEEEFKAGLCAFRETDLPLAGCFGEMAYNANEAITLLEKILANGGKPEERFVRQMEDFFLYYDNSQCKRIYHSLHASE